ncbi:MAG TPA: ABC transporter permease [Rhizobiaceae bacterium]|nr:ABC transporter permease [Rhizobiaceae bacterium]
MIDNIIHAAFVMTTPILLAALGGLINRIGGLVNIGLDSMMLAGALLGLIVASQTGSWSAALLVAAVAGGILGLLMSLTVTRLEANEIIVGLGFNIAVAGLVRFFLKSAYGSSGTLSLPDVARLPRFEIPVVADIPVLGAIFSGHDPLTWAAWLMVPLTAWFLARTRAGLRLRATGAAPQAARALGLNPLMLRDMSTAYAGIMSGLAGAYLSIGVVGIFNEGITAGRGFIALAAFYFGRNRPWLTAACALLFGFFDAFQIRLQGRGVPAELVQTLPYVMVIVVLTLMALAVKRARAKGIQS